MGREIKRVKENFNYPIGKIWYGYAIEGVKHFVESLLSAYEIQSTSYKRYPNGK